MKKKLAFLFCLSVNCALAQPDMREVAEAEKAFDNGRYGVISTLLCPCLEKLWDSGRDPAKEMAAVLGQANDSLSSCFGKEKHSRFFFKHIKFLFFENEKHEYRYRILLLLSKSFKEEGNIQLAEYFAGQASLLYPGRTLETETPSMTRLYENQRDRVRENSFGPLIGWSYAWAIPTSSDPEENSFIHQTSGRVVLGVQYHHSLSKSLSLNVNFYFHSTNILYNNADTDPVPTFTFSHSETQNWIKLPVLIKWQPGRSINRFHEYNRPRVILGAGISANVLTSSSVTLVDKTSGASLYGVDVLPYRNAFNSDAVVQGLLRVKVGRNYLNVGLTGTYSLMEILNKNMIGSSQNQLYRDYGIVESNYRIFGGFWTFTYEFRYTHLRK
jgi:hypothetical protein